MLFRHSSNKNLSNIITSKALKLALIYLSQYFWESRLCQPSVCDLCKDDAIQTNVRLTSRGTLARLIIRRRRCSDKDIGLRLSWGKHSINSTSGSRFNIFLGVFGPTVCSRCWIRICHCIVLLCRVNNRWPVVCWEEVGSWRGCCFHLWSDKDQQPAPLALGHDSN